MTSSGVAVARELKSPAPSDTLLCDVTAAESRDRDALSAAAAAEMTSVCDVTDAATCPSVVVLDAAAATLVPAVSAGARVVVGVV